MLAQKLESWLRSLEPPRPPAVTDLLSAAAHELRTPLTTLLVQAQDIERRAIEHPERCTDPAAVHRIAAEARRLRTLIEVLIEAAAVEAGQLVTDLEPVDLVALAHQVCATHGDGRAAVDASSPVVGLYDRRRMGLVIESLVENAVKYGGADTPIRVVVWRQGALAYVTVQDRGMGIPADDLPHVFERFQRGRSITDQAVPGLGLGLYLAKAIVRAHEGAVAIHSTPLEGTTVTIALPCPQDMTAEERRADG